MRHLMIGAAAAILAGAALACAPQAQAMARAQAQAASPIAVPPLAYKVRTLANGLKL
jgi:hypothetical protein